MQPEFIEKLLTLNLSYVTPQDRVTVVINLAALAARGGAEL